MKFIEPHSHKTASNKHASTTEELRSYAMTTCTSIENWLIKEPSKREVRTKPVRYVLNFIGNAINASHFLCR